MTQVDFYILEQPGEQSSQLFACRLAEKAWRQGHKVHIHTGDSAQAARLDEMLWTFRELSFVPHAQSGSGEASLSPIHIGHDEQAVCHDDVLINLDTQVPLFFSRFRRVAELVGKEEDARQLGRQRFGFYRDRGYSLQTHTIAAEGTR